MFEWCQGSKLRAMINAGVPDAMYDDWLEGWMFGLVQGRLEPSFLRTVLDVSIGEGPRPYLEFYRKSAAEIDTVTTAQLKDHDVLRAGAEKYDLVSLLSLEREECLLPLDFENPVKQLELIFDATKYLAKGGVLLWSYLYCFPADPESMHAFLEPEAIYNCLVRRGYCPLSKVAGDYVGKRRVLIYQDPDTLFVRQRAILEHSNRHERVTRVFCGIIRRGEGNRMRYISNAQLLERSAADSNA